MRDNNTVIQPGGLSTDTSYVNQPQGATTFVLNGVNETVEGDKGFIANEESNEPCYPIPQGFTPIGKVYIGNDETLLFLCSTNGNSMLAIVDRECNFSIQVSDVNQTEKFGFKISQQIDATFRLRKGCERVIYWIDPKPRIFILEKPEKFQDNNTGDWDISKFNLFKIYKTIPNFDEIEVLNNGGNLLSGSYNFSIQYLDEDLNPTEFITSSETVQVYNSDFTLPFKDIRGSTNTVTEYQNFGRSDKAIKVVLSNLDETFPFYRLAITEATGGTGQITDTKFTQEISTQNNVFTYTGNNFESSGTQSDVLVFKNIIEKAESIEQVENTLLLGNVKGKEVNLCNLQKYASKICADMVTKKVALNNLIEGNSKHASVNLEGLGYMPGEIYSFGIVYIFDDNTLTPVYHIPGKSNLIAADTIFDAGQNIYPMALNNTSADNEYTDNDSCGGINYWGVDSEGTQLTGQLVRHHRFPLRTDVNIPLIERISSNSTTNVFKRIKVNIAGSIPTPTTCPLEDEPGYDPACVPIVANTFQYNLNYTKDGGTELNEFIGQVRPSDYVSNNPSYIISENDYSNIIVAALVTFITLDESQENGDILRITGTLSGGVFTATSTNGDLLSPTTGLPTGTIKPGRNLTYTISLSNDVVETKDEQFTSDIFGIHFSNIEIPSELELNGNKIVGYYIVRNERIEDEKTILDSAVLTSTIQNAQFVSSGLLMPELSNDARVKKDIVSLINPEFKFNDKKYKNVTKIIQQGSFERQEAIHSRTRIIDVQDGNSFQDGMKDNENNAFQGDGNSGPDGFMLQIKTRDNHTLFVNKNSFELDASKIKEIFYLPALGDKLIQDSNDVGVDIFNLACDNKVGIMSLNENITFPIVNDVPYVYLIKDNANPYNNFRLTPYYKETKNPIYFSSTESKCDVFNGDSYITPLKYTNSIFYNNRLRKRAAKTSVWNYIAAALLVIVAVVIAIFTWGAGTAGSIALIGVAAAMVGGAAALTASGIKQDAWARAYSDLYDKGLRETIVDNYILFDADPNNREQRGFAKNPGDDEIQWLGESLNLWFESNVNMNLRQGATDNTPDFLNAPGNRELGTSYPEWNREYFGIDSVGSRSIPPTTSLDNHMVKKLTYLNSSRKGGRAYIGLALAEIYQINQDYKRRNKEKIYNHLPLEYDCCSDCTETFPHRLHWSQQAFQEELTDNFRNFLPNNYKDIEGETGVITDLFRIQNNLYIHTEEALWHQPQNFQERVTDNIISFIGTGEYFNIPPRKIVDDNNSSSGNTHKWGRLKTKNGVLFPCHKEKKWYLFNGQSLQPISDTYNSNYFRENMKFRMAESYYNANHINYPYNNNPSNPIGVGYISTYDTKKERLIITKKDFDIAGLPDGDYQLCNEGLGTVIFPNLSQIIANRLANGWNYIGVENCKLKFEKTVIETRIEIRTITTNVPNNSDIVIQFDRSGSFGNAGVANVKVAVLAWFTQFKIDNPTFTGRLIYVLAVERCSGQAWLSVLRWLQNSQQIFLVDNSANPLVGVEIPITNFNTISRNIIIVSTVNEAAINNCGGTGEYHTSGISNPTDAPSTEYINDFNDYNTRYDALIAAGYSIHGLQYPIVYTSIPGPTRGMLQHSISAITGRTLNATELAFLTANINPFVPTGDYALLLTALAGVNPYPSGLSQRNWQYKHTRGWDGTGDIISPLQFATDINGFLGSLTTTTQVEVEVQVPVLTYEYENGIPLETNLLNNSFTMSYSLKDTKWISWHSYLPSFYMHVQEKFYSWREGLSNIWRHGRKNHYQNFYGERHPFIIEYVDNSNALISKIYDAIKFQTEAKQYDIATDSYVDKRYITFNKVMAYNTHQISGILDMLVKDVDLEYMNNQVENSAGFINLDRNERDWCINDLRDLSVNPNVSIFNKNLTSLQADYFIDKIVNSNRIDYNKDWTEMESFRDKFLVVRLIFDTFDTTRLIMNFSVQDSKVSER
jgi:hypothetical protein